MWYYNPILGEYYRYIIQDAIGSQGKIVVGYEYMTAAEAEALKQAYIDMGVANEAYGATFAVPDEAAYATLEVYDLTGDGTGEYGFYEGRVSALESFWRRFRSVCAQRRHVQGERQLQAFVHRVNKLGRHIRIRAERRHVLGVEKRRVRA